MAVMWALGRKYALFRTIVIANVLFTFALLVHTSALVAVLFGGASEAVNALLVDVVLMATANILIFSIWYWIIDPPGVAEVPRPDEPREFLFPQARCFGGGAERNRPLRWRAIPVMTTTRRPDDREARERRPPFRKVERPAAPALRLNVRRQLPASFAARIPLPTKVFGRVAP